jgi:hypothetical protein
MKVFGIVLGVLVALILAVGCIGVARITYHEALAIRVRDKIFKEATLSRICSDGTRILRLKDGRFSTSNTHLDGGDIEFVKDPSVCDATSNK